MNISNILLWIIFGGLAGWIASLMVGDTQIGIVGNILVGIAGAFIGGWIADRLHISQPGVERPTGIMSFIIAVIGAVILLLIINLIF